MTEKNILKIRLIYRVLLSISIIAAGLCLIYGCLSIYYSGNDQPYSREAVAAAFGSICIPVYVCLGLVAISAFFNIFAPAYDKKIRTNPSRQGFLRFLLCKKDLSACDENQLSIIKKERKNRAVITTLQALTITLSSTVFLIYVLDGSHFDKSEINSSMIKAMWVLLPCLAVMLVCSIIAAVLRERSIQREIDTVKKIPSVNPSADKSLSPTSHTDKTLLIIRLVLLIAGLAILVYGFASGGVADVLTKAVNICTECIGLG